MLNINWKKAQTVIATKLFQDSSYQHHRNVLTVYDKGRVSFVTTADGHQNMHMYCCITWKKVHLPLGCRTVLAENPTDGSFHFVEPMPSTSQAMISWSAREIDSKSNLAAKMKQIQEWFAGDSFESFNNKDHLRKQIQNLQSDFHKKIPQSYKQKENFGELFIQTINWEG